MSVSRSSRRLTFIQAVSLCVCVVNAFEADAGLKNEVSAHDDGLIRQATNQSTEYAILPSGAIQLPPLNTSYPKLHSGPILILDRSTLYVTTLRYDGKLPDVQFRASNSSSHTSGPLLFIGNDSADELHAHWGQNVFFKLPDNITIYEIEYIHVWSRIAGVVYGNILIPSNIKVPDKRSTQDQNGKKLIWLPKCCNIGEAYGSEGCNKSSLQFFPQTGFLEMNTTHINNESLSYECATYEPYTSLLQCKNGKIALYPDEDQFLYLQNGSLLYIDERILLSQDQYCVETLEEIEAAVPFICLRPRGTPEVIYYIYASGMLVSCVFYILTGAIFYFVFEDCKVRIRCIILYSFCTAGSFATLSSAQLFHVEGETCNAVGYILEFFFVLSFAWLAILSYETQYIIRRPPKKRYQNRFKIYCGLTIVIAVILVILTVAMSEIPFLPEQILKPQFGHNSCVFDEQSHKTLFFYMPIFTGIFISIGYLIYAKYLINKKSKIEEENSRIIRHDLKSKFRACWILVGIATLCWIMEVLSFALSSQSGIIVAMDIVECLQGLFVFIIFVLHNPVKDKLATKLCSSKPQNQNGNVVDDNFLSRLNEMDELRPLHELVQNKPPTVIQT